VFVITLGSRGGAPQPERIVDYRITQAGGRALPAWLDRQGIDSLQGRWPADLDHIDIEITAIMGDGSSESQTVRIHRSSGRVDVILDKRSDIAPPLFRDRFASTAQPGIDEINAVASALEPVVLDAAE
jgi:hypothetical protein